VLAGSLAVLPWQPRAEHSNIAELTISAVCAPYLLGDPFDIADGFDTDSSGDYTKDADGALLAVKGGQLAPGQIGTSRWRHTVRGYAYGDCQATLKFTTGPTLTNFRAEVFVCADTAGADTFLFAALDGAGTTALAVGSRVTGVESAGVTSVTPTVNTTYWLRVRRSGRRLTAELFTSEPTPAGVPAANVNVFLSEAQVLQFATGHAGFRLAVASTAERYDDFVVEPLTYALATLPDERPLRPLIPGDAPALADLVCTPSGGAAAPIWALAAWWPRPAIFNTVWNGNFEDDVDGWTAAAVAGINGAATSIARDTTAAQTKYGTANAKVITPATSGTGASFFIARRFRADRTYVALLWAASAAQTTQAGPVFGINGDLSGFSTLAALGPTPALHYATWTPALDRDGAYVGFTIRAATATTMNLDGVCVFEGRVAPLSADISSAAATSCTVTKIPDDWPAAPFLALLDNELVRVDAVNTSTGVLTIVRGAEGTTAATHTAATSTGVIPLPAFRYQREGAGAPPPLGAIEAESDDAGDRFTVAATADANARFGTKLYASGLGAGGSAAADWLLDPNLLVPDEYAQGEIAIEVWGRLTLHAGLTAPTAIISAAPETATVAAGVLSSSFGNVRYSEEYGSAGKALIKPSAGEVLRLVRLGTIRMSVDSSRPQRWRLQLRLTWSAAAAAAIGVDYLVLVPSSSRCLSPSGKANDANYPKFVGSTGETKKTIRSDLSGLVAKPPLGAHPDSGLGGNLIEIPPGATDWLIKLSSLVPDDPTADTTTEQLAHTATVHLAVTPRYILARGS
jgi:hypothetical protein